MKTREEYIKALEIVIEYHEQLKQYNHLVKITVDEFIEKCRPSVRLNNYLRSLGKFNENNEYIEPFIDDVDILDLINRKGYGMKTALEFKELKNKYYNQI